MTQEKVTKSIFPHVNVSKYYNFVYFSVYKAGIFFRKQCRVYSQINDQEEINKGGDEEF